MEYINIEAIKRLTGGDGFYKRELVEIKPSATERNDPKNKRSLNKCKGFRIAYFDDENEDELVQ